MNFLAHLLLAGPDPASRIGNLLGDFVKGTPESLENQFPPKVLAGIMMHRRLDLFTDQHRSFLAAKELLTEERRRFAGIIVDVFFDHFLSRCWDKHCEQALPKFVEEIFELLKTHPDWLSENLLSLLPRMRRENWLMCYGTVEGLNLTFARISRRSPRLTAICEATEDLTDHYPKFQEAFDAFYPDVKEKARSLLG